MRHSDYPALYRAADEAAKDAQQHFWVALGAYLSFLISAAVMSFIDHEAQWFYLVQAFLLLGSLSVAIYLAHMKPQRAWYAARALAESVKTVTWRYMMMAEPFEEIESRDLFVRSLRKILEANRQAAAVAMAGGTDQISQLMEEVRSRELEGKKKAYGNWRIDDQLDWYQHETKKNKKRATVWLGCLIGVNALAVVFAFSKAVSPSDAWPTEILLAMAGAGMTWLQAKRYQELSTSYALTAHEISFVRAELSAVKDETSFSHFVGDAENAFSREHTQWQARKDDL